ncbi:MAG: hypothetical protein EXR07_21700 [Acetobacteraceae bacterium]|nr:hypothetical protein [Acetobacteraceae bacterium]
MNRMCFLSRGRLARLAVCLTAIAWPTASFSKTADCRIESGGKIVFSGPCDFFSDGTEGSFGLGNRDKQKQLYPGILSVYVGVVSPGVADVRGLTRDGINSRWGEAKRSAKDRACWIGTDFSICAR